ncbi:alpha/beta fold hydrolase [Ramlibacter sp. 2FC]|uniref:alpha/beta fold hydrolase n=1 Tax=Ramlibacter sp. 2FC TaxID=2502188 RepID=UPI00148586CE|nr:alpha/beta fold hydrolase [Ramlibacter sp. 2FC]
MKSHPVSGSTTPALSGPRPWRLATSTGLQSGWRLGEAGGAPWLALHGGPGSGASPALLAAFDGARHAAWGPHQRGSAAAGGRRSARLPVAAMVSDLEALRVALAVPRWSLLGGSWGSYLALAYLRRHPASVERLVLRGSFLGGADDVWGLVRAMPRAALRRAGLPPPSRLGLPGWLAAAHRLLRFATPVPAARELAHAWGLAEGRSAARGARRAWLHAADARVAAAVAPARLRSAWSDLRRSANRSAAAQRMGRPLAPAQQRKLALQARLLSRGCDRLLRGALPDWREWLAQAGPGSVRLLHGRFDAVCTPRNTRRLQAWLAGAERAGEEGEEEAVGAVVSTWVHAGHLASEPAMALALRAALCGAAAPGPGA